MALKHLVDLDLAGNEIQNVVLQNLATAPTGVAGQIFYDTANSAVKVHTGSGFVRIGASADGTTLTESSGVFSVGTIAISNTSGLQTALNAKADTSALPEPSAILYGGGNPSLPSGITAAEIRTLIGAGTSSLSLGSTSSTALAGNTTTITTSQASAITANSGKVSMVIGSTGETAMAGDTRTITSSEITAISNNSAKTGITSAQATAITNNSAKTGITSAQATAISNNSAKTGITSAQASAITANTAKVSDTGTPAILSNGTIPSLNSGISAGEMRTLIGAGTSSFNGAYTSLTSIPSTFAPSAHTHEIEEITGLESALNAKAPAASPAFTGTPTAPTAAGSTNTTQVATTAFVVGEIGRLIDSAPAALDTLNEIAASLNDDSDFAGTMTTALGTKLAASSYTAADVLAKIKTVDGAGSGLDSDKLDGQSSAYYRNYNNLTNKPSVPTFVSKSVTGASSGATDLELGYGGYANIQVYDENGNLVVTDIVQNGTGSATAQLPSGVDFRIVAVGA